MLEQKNRCSWVKMNNPLYVAYHDTEWGIPVHDERTLFEFLTLESAQAGLSWETILNKRENYRKAFDNFDYQKIAVYGEDKVEELLKNKGIIRNKLKILATINNAQKFIEIQKEFGSFDKYLWDFVHSKPIQNEWNDVSQVPAKTALSDALSKDLKKRGFKFLGSTTCYSHIQATGMVNDHTTDCFRYEEIRKMSSV